MLFHVFADCLEDKYHLLSKLCSKQQPGILVKVFIDQVGAALQDEIRSSRCLRQPSIPHFNTIKQLNEQHYRSTIKDLRVDNALDCIAQLCHYIHHVERCPGALNNSRQAGFAADGLGLTCAVLMASSVTSGALITNAVQATLLAFRLGSYVGSVVERISSVGKASDVAEVWSYNFPGLDLEAAELCLNNMNTPIIANKAYISRISAKSVEISGPPPVLRMIIDQSNLPRAPIPSAVYGPYRASHLHSSVELDEILGLEDISPQDVLHQCCLGSPIISAGGTWARGSQTIPVVKAVVHEYLNHPFVAASLARNCISALEVSNSLHCVVNTYGRPELGKELSTSVGSLTHITLELRLSCQGIEDAVATHSSHKLNESCKLAIVGMAGRFPDADNTDELWELLANGDAVHRVVPEDRFPLETHVDPEGKATNTSYTPYGCWIRSPGLFDHKFFNMSSREALQTDPMQRLALVTAYEALEMSGYTPNRTLSTRLHRIGTFYGQTSDDWREINAAQDIDTYYITGGIRAFGPGRINYFFKFQGPSFSIDTACSSSAAALQVACTSLLAKECDTAVVGGLSILTNPDLYCGLSRGQFLSKSGPCATFDDAADGYCRADACASLVVKRMDDAIADKDNILAVILGTATNHSADSISITHPHGPTQSSLYYTILDRAGVEPLDVDYIEMHGTGTQAGDSIEMASVLNVFAPDNKYRTPDRPLYLGAVKSNVGHGEAASGITSVIKVLKMLQQDTIPPHIGIKPGSVLNKAFPKDLATRNVRIVLKNTPFKRFDGKPRRIFVNNFSAAGGNTGLLLEEATPQPRPDEDPRDAHVILVTAKSKAALARNTERLASWIADHPDTPISHVAYTTTARRIQHGWRIGIVASTLDEARQSMGTAIQPDRACAVGGSSPPVCFLFTGQGSFYRGMGEGFYRHYSRFRQSIREFEHISEIHGFPSFLSLINGDDADSSIPSPIAVQLAIVCFEMAAVELWQSWGVKPAVVLGHSLGEYAALYAAGVLSASEAIYLVGERARLVLRNCTPDSHAMLAVKASPDVISPILGRYRVEITCLNGPEETVLGGDSLEISKAAEQLKADGISCTKLGVPFAFHSSQMDPVLDELESISHHVTFFHPKVPFVSTMLGRQPLFDETGPAYIRGHSRGAVRFHRAVLSAQELAAVDHKMIWLEIGPHAVCINMVRSIIGASTITLPTARRKESIHRVLGHSVRSLHSCGIDLDWNEFHRDFSKSTALVELPSYSFEEKTHWIQYHGDWTLSRKTSSTAAAAPLKKKLSTTSVHQVVREVVMAGIAMIDTETDVSRHDIRPTVTGHQCNGVPLCPASLYAEIAMAVSDYAFKLIRPDDNSPSLSVANLSIQKAFLFDDRANTQILRCTVETHATGDYASVVFYTRDGLLRSEHALCTVHYGDVHSWVAEFRRMNYLVMPRINGLSSLQTTGAVVQFSRAAAYESFANFVVYGSQYQGMNDVLLHTTTGEATAQLIFQTKNTEDFFFNPYWIDSCCHLSGFILNAKEAIGSREQVFISDGWESLRFTERLDPRMSYRSYTRMQPMNGTEFVEGDVYILKDDCIIGVAKGLRFRLVPRRILGLLLPSPTRRPLANSYMQSDSKSTLRLNSSELAVGNGKRDLERCPVQHSPTQEPTSLISAFLIIVQLEVGCEPNELEDSTAFSCLGCDSLMGLVISSRMRQEWEIDIRPQAFQDYPTIGQFKSFLAGLGTTEAEYNAVSMLSKISSIYGEPDLHMMSGSATTTSQAGENKLPQRESKDISGAMHSENSDQTTTTARELLIPIPSGLGLSQVWKTTGSLTTSSCDVSSGSSNALLNQEKHSDDELGRPEHMAPFSETFQQFPHQKAKSVLLQGNSRTAGKTLFMIPDGSGSAYSYSELGSPGPDWAVWGFFSPFMKTPDEYTCGIEGIAQAFIEEMKRRQSAGPYALAGWSVGGAIAYEMASQLARSNDEISHLILIDSPCPLVGDPLPKYLSRWFSEIGVIGSTGNASLRIPDWLLPHFDVSAEAFANYKPEPIPRERCPRTVAIWCEDGVCKTEQDPRPHPYPTGHALFLLENRRDFGTNRWGELLAPETIQTRRMGGNHFSMMRGVLAQDLTGLIRQALMM